MFKLFSISMTPKSHEADLGHAQIQIHIGPNS